MFINVHTHRRYKLFFQYEMESPNETLWALSETVLREGAQTGIFSLSSMPSQKLNPTDTLNEHAL